ncbi:MAG: SpoIIE family protein phosphatase, partial [Actinobacteria bacterium]|nr:SpoIIE family protein phosphatase [Actinomycetota bacterium]
RVNRYWEKKVAESREIVSDQLKGVSKIMEGLAGEIRVSFDRESGRPAGARRPAPKLQYQVGVSRVAKKGSLISGDSFLSKTLEKEGKLILALSDGMGAGPRAAVESRATISLLEKLLETGFDIDIAVKTINSTLLLRSPDEMFATVDLAIIDLVSGNSEFIKIGAAPSFIKRGSEVTAIKTASLPIGILSQIEIESTRRVLGPGDMVVMMTDGLLEVRKDLADKEAWVTRLLKEFPRNEPQILAETLLSGALEGNRREVGDDITVMVLRLDSVDREAAGEESAPAETGPYRWAKAQWKKIR